MPFWEGGAKKLLLSLHRWREGRGGGVTRLPAGPGPWAPKCEEVALSARERATCPMTRALGTGVHRPVPWRTQQIREVQMRIVKAADHMG